MCRSTRSPSINGTRLAEAPANEVISNDVVQLDAIGLQKKIMRPRARLQKLNALLRVMIAVLKLS